MTTDEISFPRDFNAAADLLDSNIEQGRGDKVAFIDVNTSLTYGELQARANKVANLWGRLGIGRETRIAQVMIDTVDFPAVFLGSIKAGVIPIPLNTLLSAEYYNFIFNDSRCQAIIVSAALLDIVEQALEGVTSVQHVIVVGGEGHRHEDFHRLIEAENDSFEAAKTCSDETAFWLYSSGTTGMPKGVTHIHTSLRYTAATFAQKNLAISEEDVSFSAAKLFFAYGLGNGLTFPMSVGSTAVLLDGPPTPASVIKVMKEHQPTLFYGVPTLYAAMLADSACTPENGSAKLRRCISAGEGLPRDVGERWQDRFGVEIIDGVGTTELLHIFLSNRPGDVHYGKSGVPVEGYEVKLVDEDGMPVAIGEIGELAVNGPSAAECYWNQREKTRATFRGEWTFTGDKYFVDEEGQYNYCGRSDDMFKTGGIWVSPFEVESALVSHAKIVEAAVVPHEDKERLLKPKAFVILAEGVTNDEALYKELKTHVQDQVGKWKYPRWIEAVEELPKTATGKIQRFKLRG